MTKHNLFRNQVAESMSKHKFNTKKINTDLPNKLVYQTIYSIILSNNGTQFNTKQFLYNATGNKAIPTTHIADMLIL